eukprot:499359_1
MEKDMLLSFIVDAFLQHNVVYELIDVDGDAKIPKLTKAVSNIMIGHVFKIGSDRAHNKKNMPKHIYKMIHDLYHNATARGVTQLFTRLVVQRLFQFSFHDKEVTDIDDAKKRVALAKKKMQPVLIHMFPSSAKHSQCKSNGYTFCKIAFGGSKNQSSHLKSKYPVGIRTKFTKCDAYKSRFSDKMIEIYTSPGCTSLNESANHCGVQFVCKNRFLGQFNYFKACSKGVGQWNYNIYHFKHIYHYR